jgi:DNA primase
MAVFDPKAVKQASNIVDVARELGFEMKNNRTRCFFPQNHEHGDRTPSLSLNQRSNAYHCYVCNTHGDVIDLVMKVRGLSFPDALKFLADRSGIKPTSQPLPKKQHVISEPDLSSGDVAGFAEVYKAFDGLLSDLIDPARDCLTNRGIPPEVATQYGARSLREVRRVSEELLAKYPLEQLQASGLFDRNGRLIFRRHRLIWKWMKDGVPVFFQGRALDSETRPKEMCLAHPIPYPFNVDYLRSNPAEVFICEGVVDTLTLLKYGKAAVGVVGVNGFKENWIPLFQGFRVKVAFDADAAGQSRGAELIQRLRSHGIDAARIFLPANYDVNQYFQVLRQFGM